MSLNIAVIPARGGSKRLPGKNIKLLAGKPLICWTIDAALQSQLFDLVLVSTDSPDIAQVAQQSGAIVPGLRPSELASDTATTNDVISHMVDLVETKWGEVSTITLLQPTSPLRTSDNIRAAHDLFLEKKAAAVVTVCQLEHPIQLCNRLPSSGCLHNFIRPENNKRAQDLEPYYRINGAIYIFNRQFVDHLVDMYCENSYAYVMSADESIDIDEQLDFDLAELIIKRR
ncbi:cytidylyltransferase domain-containing protein [Aeromonas caviae]|uniref:acylneuraminate cytidylyltransferase family protein n=1 Tax=Aeromonas caviae TaxID=648 RepID=UPI000D68E01A|nr:acylneuraminate cytidylyltransferase family protein [Aeromonas caviae]